MERRKKRLEWFIPAVLIITVAACATLLLLLNDVDKQKEPEKSMENDVLTAKINFYEGKIAELSEQLSVKTGELEALRASIGQQTETKPSDENTPDTENPTNPESPAKDDPTNAEEKASDGEFTYRIDGENVILTSYIGTEKKVIVPAAVDGKIVIGLDEGAFSGRDVSEVYLPGTIRSVGWFCFYQCESLDRVTLPSEITEIGYACFDGCPKTLIISVFSGSYAEEYVKSFGLNYSLMEKE